MLGEQPDYLLPDHERHYRSDSGIDHGSPEQYRSEQYRPEQYRRITTPTRRRRVFTGPGSAVVAVLVLLFVALLARNTAATPAPPTAVGTAPGGARLPTAVPVPRGGSELPFRTATPSAGSSAGSLRCSAAGRVTYTLDRTATSTPQQTDVLRRITAAMDDATSTYNCYTSISKALWVVFDPAVTTNAVTTDGVITFGPKSDIQKISAMYAIAHALGVGSTPTWTAQVLNGIWTGPKATATLRSLTGVPNDVVHADRVNFWPYGLNYLSEVKSGQDLMRHCLLVQALLQDMGL
jgi:hypothetical protein